MAYESNPDKIRREYIMLKQLQASDNLGNDGLISLLVDKADTLLKSKGISIKLELKKEEPSIQEEGKDGTVYI